MLRQSQAKGVIRLADARRINHFPLISRIIVLGRLLYSAPKQFHISYLMFTDCALEFLYNVVGFLSFRYKFTKLQTQNQYNKKARNEKRKVEGNILEFKNDSFIDVSIM